MPLILAHKKVSPGNPPVSRCAALAEKPIRAKACRILRPQAGQQEKFFASPADIVIYGGAAGGGKSYALLLEAMRHVRVKDFGAVIFRKTYPEIESKGGLWDTSLAVYDGTGAIARESDKQWVWPNNVDVKFSHMQYDKDVLTWKGSQIPYIGFDELTAFSEYQFFYMMSRNRSLCGVRPYIRATTNPDPDSWVAEFLAWWIDQTTGFPIPERDGCVRYFVRQNGKMLWGNTAEELPQEKTPDGIVIPAKSVAFVRSNIYDNPILLKADPSYLGNLTSLPKVEREQLLDGNWKVRRTQGSYFRRHHARIIETLPLDGIVDIVRGWDRAATEVSELNKNPDWTAGVKIIKYKTGRYVIADVRRDRCRPFGVQQLMVHTAMMDQRNCSIAIAQDPGSAGVGEKDDTIRVLAGYVVHAATQTGPKHLRWLPLSTQWENGNVDVLRGPWNDDFFIELESLGPNPDMYEHDDQADAAATSFARLTTHTLPGAYVA